MTKPPKMDMVLTEDLLSEATGFGEGIARLSIHEAIAAIGMLYTSSLPGVLRAKNGIFYTPPPLVVRLVDQATHVGVDWSRCKVISPACGGGQFLVEDARRIASVLGNADPAIIISSVGARLRGWDIDPFATWLSHVAVETLLIPHVVASGKRLVPITETRDSLLSDLNLHEGAYDLVNENPAFGKVKDTPAIRQRFSRSLHGHPNLYGMFTDLSVRLAKPRGGVVALLTPTSFFGGHYFNALRSFLVAEARPATIDIVESRKDVFPDVLQEVALSVFVKGRRAKQAECAIIHAEKNGLRVAKAGKLKLGKEPRAPWLIPRNTSDVALATALHRFEARLSDWGYTVSTGPLVWNRAEKLGHLHDSTGSGRYPIIWAECITGNGHFVLKSERREHRSFYASSFAPRAARDPNLVTTGCLLLQRTTAKEQKRRLIGALMPMEFVKKHRAVAVENHLNMVRPCCDTPSVPLEVVAAFFASNLADRIIRCISGSVALSAAEIETMPLPSSLQVREAFATSDFEGAIAKCYTGKING